ncbi:hypothetical protein [Actinophytocola sp.]|uniref:hypothetical protein n=1 Tax=Actinophytocola sp. TaxID=1872138 RepID=UPI003D6B3091
MNTVSILAAAVSVAGAVVTVGLGAYFEHRRNVSHRRARLRHRASRYSETLLQAAGSVRTRLGNVAHLNEFPQFRDSERFRDYARYESLYRIARYLGVVHIMAQEVRFLDLGSRRRNRDLVERLGAVRGVLSDYSSGDLRFLILGGAQEAIGELMIDTAATGDGPPRCVSYPVFRERLDDDPRFARWMNPVLADIDAVIASRERSPRFVPAEKALDELIEFLDRRRIWQPWDRHRADAAVPLTSQG